MHTFEFATAHLILAIAFYMSTHIVCATAHNFRPWNERGLSTVLDQFGVDRHGRMTANIIWTKQKIRKEKLY